MRLLHNYKKRLFALFVAIAMISNVIGQQKYGKEDSLRIFKYLEKADLLAEKSQLDSALFYGKLALEESGRIKLLRGESYANLKIADILYRKGEQELLGKYDSAALRNAVALKDTFLIALSYYQLGQYFLEFKKLNEAEQLFNRALLLKFEKDKNEYTAVVYNDLGYVAGERGLYDQQVEWYLKAIRLHEKNNNNTGLAQSLSNLSATYFDLNKMPEAIRYAKQAFELRQKTADLGGMALSCNNISQMYLFSDSMPQAVKYQELGLKYAEQSGIQARIAQAYVSMSLLMNRQKKIQEAFEYEKKAIALYEKIDQGVVANRYIAAAFYSNLLKDSAGAVEYFRKSETLAKSLGNKGVLRSVYSYLSDFYNGKKDYKAAYDYYKKFILYRDSLLNTETNTKIASLQTQYETEKKDFEINRLSTEQRIKTLEIEKQKAIIAGNEAEALQKQNEIDLLSKSQQLQEEQLKRQGDELEKQILLTKNNEQQLLLVSKEKQLQQKQISSQKTFRNFLLAGLLLLSLLAYLFFNRFQLKKKLEQQNALLSMRNNISENLHDDIGASLSNINILTELAKRNIGQPAKSTEYLEKAGDDIQRISENLSDIVWNINPRYDELQNLFIRMKRYAADMMDGKNISYEINFDEDVEKLSLSMEKRRNFYLIFKEAVNNLGKYSEAVHAWITVKSEKGLLKLTVKDDGKGFDKTKTSSGNGLHNMQKRANDLQAGFTVFSEPGKGTEISLSIPLT